MMRKEITPPYEMNYNFGADADSYERDFGVKERDVILPSIMKLAGLRQGVDKLAFLDLGCGWGPMAYAFSVLTEGVPGCRYLGVDIRKDAIDWLTAAYAKVENIEYLHHAADHKVDYISSGGTLLESSGDEGGYAVPEKAFDLQWSHSLFTHLTPQACHQALNSISRSLSQGGVAINTWLIIDDHSMQSLRDGVADRQLPFDFGDFLTYLQDNPLMCTAYKSPAIQRFYEEAGQKITAFLPGSWRGRGISNGVTYQDIVISQVK